MGVVALDRAAEDLFRGQLDEGDEAHDAKLVVAAGQASLDLRGPRNSCRSAYRTYYDMQGGGHVGFRIVCETERSDRT